jgi:hypothetical protein
MSVITIHDEIVPELLEALGIDSKYVTHVRLELDTDTFGMIKIERIVTAKMIEDFTTKVEKYQLCAKEVDDG